MEDHGGGYVFLTRSGQRERESKQSQYEVKLLQLLLLLLLILGSHLIMHQTIGLTGYIGLVTLTLTLVR